MAKDNPLLKAQNGEICIAPSILSANLLRLEEDIAMIEEAGAAYVHVDVMDGHFVPNITMGVPLVKQLSKVTELPLDVHLMVSNPLDQIPWFLDAGADILTVHAECLDGQWIDRAVDIIHEGGAQAALALKPHTDLSCLSSVIALLDMVLVMSVEPGFSGQKYIEGSENRVATVAAMAGEAGANNLVIEVDGGIDPSTVERVCAEGARILVCGNAVFGAENPAAALQNIKAIGERGLRERGIA